MSRQSFNLLTAWFPTKRLNPVAGTITTFIVSGVKLSKFPTKRLNPVAGTEKWEGIILKVTPSCFQQSDLTQSPGQNCIL